MSPRLLSKALNWWPPYLGAGIRVRRIADDWSQADVELALRWWNRNYFGTHFGGSLFSLTDPFFALLLVHRLGDRYLVWDRAGRIDYLAPGRGTVRARFVLPEDRVENLRAQTAGGEKCLPEFSVDVVHAQDGGLVARVHRTLYVRLKRRYRPASAGPGDDE